MSDSNGNKLAKCVLFNARSLRNKITDLQVILHNDNACMISVTESWLDNNITDGMIDPDGSYSIYRLDRVGRIGGGVLALVSKKFQSYQIAIPHRFSGIEIVCFEVITSLSTFRFITIYRPPELNSIGRDYMKCLCECLQYLCDTGHIIVITGDLNLPRIDWSMRSAVEDDIHSLFLTFCNDYGFVQFVNYPSLGDNILDLVLSNDNFIVNSLKVTAPFSNSDHSMVYFDMILSPHESSMQSKTVYDFEHCDVDAINTALFSHPFYSSLPVGTADDVWDKFIAPINKIIADLVPVKIYRPLSRIVHVKRYPTHIKRALRKKCSMWRLYRNDRSVSNKTIYAQQANYCKALIFDFEKSKEIEVVNSANLGKFYRYVNKKLSCSSGIGPLRSSSGALITNDAEKSTILNDFFGSVFTFDNGLLPDFIRRVPDDVCLDSIDVTSDIIINQINKCKSKSSPGPDGIPQSFIKTFKFSLAQPLTILFKHLIALGSFPSEWKYANVTPVFKKGLSSEVTNYRPISLTSVFSKLLERVVYRQMLNYLNKYKLISPHQHGFLAKHSTCTQLLESVNDWSLALRNRNIVDTVYFDFCKAFDTVSHEKLLHKLRAYGFAGQLLSFIGDFLTGRSQRVVLSDGLSGFKPVLSGVPQGSVLGPLLFLIYINDICDLFSTSVAIKLFADDIKIYMEIIDGSDAAVFQSCINSIADWADIWQLKLAYQKCHHMSISLKSHIPATYYIKDTPLLPVNVCTDLGVKVTSLLSFSPHVDFIVAKAKIRANQILRCFISRDCCLLTKAFITYVRPILEYCSPVWSPCYISFINKLESVQRVFTKRLVGMSELSYDERLSILGLQRLELRRFHADLIACYNIIHNQVNINREAFFAFAPAINNTRGHSLKLLYPDSRINVRAHSFSVRVISIWNRLPESVVTAASVGQFKLFLREIDFTYALLGKL
jgi:hypothetical protein